MKTDYLIIGQGICGTLLSYELVQAGKKVLVMDAINPATSSRVASGLINPVTGKRIVASWMIDELLPVAMETYQSIERLLGVSFLQQCPILEFYRTAEERDMFLKRVSEGCAYLDTEGNEEAVALFNHHYGTGTIKDSMLIDLQVLLAEWRNWLLQQNALVEGVFDHNCLLVKEDGIAYEGIDAERVIFCNGVASFDNPWFSKLPYTFNKGEVLIASIPDLPRHYIYKQGIKIIPWKEDLFWVGASYEWTYSHKEPTEHFKQKVEEHLKYWLKLPFETVGHYAAERPATVDYKPFIGFHPVMPAVGIMNGMGSKGCSQAPYFARELAAHLVNGAPLNPEADIKRFAKILAR